MIEQLDIGIPWSMINKQRDDDGLQKKTDEQNEQKFGKEFMLFDFFLILQKFLYGIEKVSFLSLL